MKLTDLRGLGAKTLQKLAHFNIYSLQDLLLHLPFRYQDKTQFSSLSTAKVGDEVLLKLKIKSVKLSLTNKKQLICYLEDNCQQSVIWRFFNFSDYQHQSFKRETEIECFGELKITHLGLEMFHPEYRLISQNQATLLSPTLTPVYSCREGIYQNQLRKWIIEALDHFNQSTENSEFKTMINLLHNPSKDENLSQIMAFQHPAQQQLIIQEFAARKLAMLQARDKIRRQQTSAIINANHLTKQLKLDFELTTAQQIVINEIKNDMKQQKPMLRLLQGDVGCGKTIVAIIASLCVVESNKQVAVMSPTAILSEQHLNSFTKLLTPLGVKIAFLVSTQNTQERRENLALIKTTADIIIGTHSIFQKEVMFRDLSLVIIDEQHKFGVKQRLQLNQKSKTPPHTLAMTATPIPRSIMMSLYGEMDISIINELPKGRQEIQTIAINSNKKQQLLDKINAICQQGQQVYWVCTLIDESQNFNAVAANESFQFLSENLPHLKIVLIHSKIEKIQKQQIMQDFVDKKTNILVATTVIEVGVDVPNANLMIVENAEKLGLAQLHQLRGRVGRGISKSLCIFMYNEPLSNNAKQRLKTLRETTDGFKIAKKDLQLRGAGEVLGVNQTGLADFKIADLVRDEYLLNDANQLAKEYFGLSVNIQNQFIHRWVSEKNQDYAKS